MSKLVSKTITALLFALLGVGVQASADVDSGKYRNLDGSGNNPNGGEAHTPLGREAAPEYADGLSAPAGDNRPSAREISNVVSHQEEPNINKYKRSSFVWAWGQFVDHTMGITEGHDPAEPFNIPVPMGDPWFDPYGTGTQEIDLNRSHYLDGIISPRQQINSLPAFIDAASVYGVDPGRNAALRSSECGKMDVTPSEYGDLLPYNKDGWPNAGGPGDDLFLAGDIRANEHIVLTSLHTLFVREHNRQVDKLSKKYPFYDCEKLYQEAKLRVEALLQAITFKEFLPSLLGKEAIPEYTGYDASVNPTILNEFSTAAYRFGHSLLHEMLERMDENGDENEYGHVRLKDGFFNPEEISEKGGISTILRGAAASYSQEVDTLIVDDVRNFLFGPPGAGGFDLASLNIQRGRDHGLPHYNAMRQAYNLAPVQDFSDITSDHALQIKLTHLYGDVNNIDAWVGGLAEDAIDGSLLGPLFHTIVLKQFLRLRDGDRYWYEKRLAHKPKLLDEIHNTRLSDVIKRNTDIEHMQDDVFQRYTRIGGKESGFSLIMGTEEDDMLMAMGGYNVLVGNAGKNYLVGGPRRDILLGGHGDDVLEGGAGGNLLIGGPGENTYRINLKKKRHGVYPQGYNRVITFLKKDTLEFAGGAVKSLAELDEYTEFEYDQTLPGLRITFSEGGKVLELLGKRFQNISSFEEFAEKGYKVVI